jgi:hypothetical protein
MSADDWTQEYHLTPHGWAKGTYAYYKQIQGSEVPRPHDAIETWEVHGYQSSIYSKESRTASLLWHLPEASSGERAAMHKQFPKPWTLS